MGNMGPLKKAKCRFKVEPMSLEQNFKLTTGHRATLCALRYVKAPLSKKNMELDITIKDKNYMNIVSAYPH